MEKIVLDTNCLLQIISLKSPDRLVWDRIMSDDVVLCVSSEILLEYTEILAIYTSRDVAENIVNAIKLRPNTQFVEPHYKWLLLPDPDDNKFVDCAISANARYVVSDDNHFKILKNPNLWPHIDLKTLKEYHEHLTHIF
ncbi:MAG: putative toxin-antitoxin system toxin component, PIN family [Bacteroidales bacterium]|nr:putative toxin-antitoxin system toxin component, PIN family [Bacteroidales bacterium]